jgi:hypothetical protein
MIFIQAVVSGMEIRGKKFRARPSRKVKSFDMKRAWKLHRKMLKVGCLVESLMRVDVLRAELAVLSSCHSS